MANISVTERKEFIEHFSGMSIEDKLTLSETVRTNPALENILSEGCDDFFQYLNWLGLAKEPNLMVLSSMQHYYYDHNDLKGITTLINLKKLNQIKHLESFLHILYRILPSESYFVGCFKSSHHHGHKSPFKNPSKFLNGIIDLLENKAERSLSKRIVRILLEEKGFSVLDMTEINRITFFWSQNRKSRWE